MAIVRLRPSIPAFDALYATLVAVRAVGVDRGDVHDRAAAVRRHDSRHPLRHEERAGEVHADDALPLFVREVEERAVVVDPRAVDKDVDRAEALGRSSDGGVDLCWFGDVRGVRARLAPGLGDRRGDALDLGRRSC